MKKIISLGIASAVLAMTALSASAAVTVKSTDTLTAGGTITVNFVVDTEIAANKGVQFNVVTTGVELVGEPVNNLGMGGFNKDTGMYMGLATNAAAAGTSVLTATYTITAKAGEQVTITVDQNSLAGSFTDALITPITGAVEGATEPGNSGDNSGSSSDDNSGSSSDDKSGNTGDGNNDNPPMGVALAVFPAIVAGAAVVVAKKRK